MPSLLEGMRILDLSRVLAGPWAGQVLADLGAEVIKVEKPGVGDDTRAWGPPFIKTPGPATDESAYFLCTNRGKKSVTIDISRREGQALIRQLAAKSDVLIENFKVGGLAKYGLGWGKLQTINPRLVYCSITGFGQEGPYSNRLGYDFLIQGMGGLMAVTGEPDGQPMKAGVAVTDLFTGMYAATAILAALTERQRSGRGQQIDIALFDVQIATLANQVMSYLVSGRQPARLGNAHPSIVPYQSFSTADGTLLVAVGNDAQFARFARAIGRPDLPDNVHFRRNEDRVRNRDILVAEIQSRLATESASSWIGKLNIADVPAGPVNTFSDLDCNEHVIARKIFKQVPHSTAGAIRSVASPMHFSRSKTTDERAAPTLGHDTHSVLRELLHLSDSELNRMQALGLI